MSDTFFTYRPNIVCVTEVNIHNEKLFCDVRNTTLHVVSTQKLFQFFYYFAFFTPLEVYKRA